MSPPTVPCPFVYANGRRCPGQIVRVEAYKADLAWSLQSDGTWSFQWDRPRSHFHLFCSEKGNHAGTIRGDDSRMKFYLDRLPDTVQQVMAAAKLSDA